MICMPCQLRYMKGRVGSPDESVGSVAVYPPGLKGVFPLRQANGMQASVSIHLLSKAVAPAIKDTRL